MEMNGTFLGLAGVPKREVFSEAATNVRLSISNTHNTTL
jgi:hypothetical protein